MREVAPPLLASLVAFAVYAATLARGVLGGDAGELQFVPPILGLTHPTGYPLQVLLHKAWSLLPIGSVAYRLNLLDALIAAAAVGLVAACGRRLVGRWVPALLGAFAFAFGELWWSQAVGGDKYTLHGFFLAMVLLLFLRWRSVWRAAGAPPAERTWGLAPLALAYGLSLTHHRGMLLVAPALGVGLLLEGWRPRDRRQPLVLLGLVGLPLLLYLYVPWAGSRGLPPGSWPVDTPSAVLEYLLDRGYTSRIRPDAALAGRLAEEAGALRRSFGPLGVLLGLLGLAWTLRCQPRPAAVLLVAFVPQAVLAASYLLESGYAIPRHWVFYLPAFLIWSLWIAAGLHTVQRGVELALARPFAIGPSAALAAAFLLVQGATAWARSAEAVLRAGGGAETLDGYRQDLQRSPLAERFGRLALDAAEPDAVVVCDWEQATVLWYLQRVEGRRPDVVVRYPIETLDESLAVARRDGRPLYVARTLPDLATRATPSSAGPLLRLLPPPGPAAPPDAIPIDARLDGGVTLVAIGYDTPAFRAGAALPLSLYWRAEAPPEHDYAVSVRLVAADGRIVAQHDERHPALGTSPTTGWRPGQVIGDYHELPLGNRLPPAPYHVAVVMYRPDPFENLRRLDTAGQPGPDVIALAPFDLAPREPGPLDSILRLTGR